jgi:hypothetical protein
MRDYFGQAGVLVVGFPERLGLFRGHQDVGRINDAAGAWDENSEWRESRRLKSTSRAHGWHGCSSINPRALLAVIG